MPSSLLYNGGGTGNALQAKTSSTDIIAAGAQIVACDGYDTLDVFACNTTAGQTGTLAVIELGNGYGSGVTLAKSHIVRVTETALGTDQTVTIDNLSFGLSTAEDKAKPPVSFTLLASWFLIVLAASGGGTWYARYGLRRA